MSVIFTCIILIYIWFNVFSVFSNIANFQFDYDLYVKKWKKKINIIG